MTTRNILFIMSDQLRADHLSCAGHPYLKTPNIDLLASKGVRFANAFVQSGVCGPSRMSFYTGRYPSSHGATWNRVPLSIGEITLGEYLNEAQLRLNLIGKTHVIPDRSGAARLALDGQNALTQLLMEGHFDLVDRYDGHHAEPDGSYARYLRAHGYDSDDPWTDFVISAVASDGQIVSGWNMRNVHLPARVREEHSETAHTTDQAIEFVKAKGDQPWALHLSYVKPHWPYMAPAPYNSLYSLDQCLPVNKDKEELVLPHPVLAAYREQEECANFMRDEVSDMVRPAYQGLIGQLDDHLGRLWEELEAQGRWKDTLIVLTADHGDYLGDHWLGEKELFHDCIQRVPFIIYDPHESANTTRGRVEDHLVEAIDTVPTILEALNIPLATHRLEGRSLLSLTRDEMTSQTPWRDAVFSELDYSYRRARLILNRNPLECRAWMVRTHTWKYVYWLGMPAQLFDLVRDPRELVDLGGESSHEAVCETMRARLFDWFTHLKTRTTVSASQVIQATDRHKQAGVFYGVW